MKPRISPSPAGKVFAYVRVSRLAQVDGESLDVQRRIIQGYAMQHGLTVDKVFVERGVSGGRKLGDRPEGSKLLAELQPGCIVIASKLDRMFRSALDALEMATKFRNEGVALHLLDLGGNINNGLGKTFFIIASAFAEAERDRTRERITEVKQDQKQRGRYLGGAVPFGHAVSDGVLVLTPEGQKAIARMRRLRAQGHSLREIRNKLREGGVSLSHAAVRLVLRRQERSRPDRPGGPDRV